MKPSKFNYIYSNQEKFCVYNSFRGHLAVIQDDSIKNLLLSEFIEISNENTKHLLDDGFIVPSNCDEDAMADVKHFDIVANKDLYLTLMPTDGCNFRCKYCYQNDLGKPNNFPNNKMDEDIQNRIFMFAKSQIKDFNGLTVEWYGGEPLLELDTINSLSGRLITLCQERGKPYYSTLTTNGYLLTEEVLLRCLKNHIYSFHVTVDGFAPIHDKFRVLEDGQGTFQTIIQNLRNIRDHVRSKYFNIVLRTNISTESIPHMEDWIKFIFEEFGQDKRFKVFMRPIEDRGGTSIKDVEDSIPHNVEKAYDILIGSKYKLDYSHHFGFLFSSLCCVAKRNSYIIDPKGIVKKCGEHLKNPLTNIGELDPNGALILDRENLAKWLYKKDLKANDKCVECKFIAACFNAHCPMKANFSSDKYCSSCGVDHLYIEKTIDLLTSKDYNFLIKY